jgi:UPF0716 family protein affecting phage T7 exclusion
VDDDFAHGREAPPGGRLNIPESPQLSGYKLPVTETTMTAGIVLILAGILLIVYPPLLSIIVAALLIFAGAMAISITRYNRKHERHFENPTVDIFFRY